MTGKVQFAQTRSSAKWPTVVSEIRRRIVAGELSPGARLPTRPQLSREFRVSQSTAQAVLDELSRARFIETRGRHGTFVAENPPHLSHYAIVFPQLHPGNAKSSLFYDAIWQAARALPLPEGCDAAMYEASVERGWDAGYRKLVHDVRHDGVAGLIFATTPFELQGTPLLNQPGIPRVAIMEPLEGINLPRVYPDFSKWYPLAFDAVQQTGRRRLGVITPTAFAETADDLVAKEAGPRGLTTSGN